jgi:hypothetical protein
MIRAARLLTVFVVVALAARGQAQPATPKERAQAKVHFDRGNQLYQQGRFADAIDELKSGYALDPRPDILYALGQAERKRGDCKAAIRYYEQFVDSGVSAQRAQAVKLQIDRCQKELATSAPASPPVETSPPPPAPVTPEPPARPTPPPKPVQSAQPAPPENPTAATTSAARAPEKPPTPAHRRWWVWTLVGGAVAVGVGVGLGVGLTQRGSSFSPTLPDLVAPATAAAVVHF